jgi:hypothetical protein
MRDSAFFSNTPENSGAWMIEALFRQRLITEGEEVLELRSGDLDQSVLASVDDRTGDLALGFDDLVDFLLDSSAANELVNLNVVLLTDSECTVRCLVLDGGVPPPLEMEDMIGGRQVQPCPHDLEKERTERQG